MFINKIILSVLLFSLICSGSALSDLAATMKEGEWKEFTSEGLNRSLFYIDINGQDGSTKCTDYSNRLSWDSNTKSIHYLGLGHYRAWKFFRYLEENDKWEGIPLLPDSCMYTGGSCICHGYNNGTIDTDSSCFYFMQCAFSYSPVALHKLYRFDIRTNTWSSIDVPSTYVMAYGFCLTYFPPLKSLIQLKQKSLNQYNLSTGFWSSIPATGLPNVSYHQCMTYSDKERKMVFGGGQLYKSTGDSGLSAIFMMDSSKNVTMLPSAPTPFYVQRNVLVSDPVSGEILLIGTDSALYSLDLSSPTEWKKLSDRRPPFGAPSLATPIHDYGVILFLVPNINKAFLYKHKDSENVATENGNRINRDKIFITVTPNPVNGFTIIRMSGHDMTEGYFSIFNPSGTLIAKFILENGRNSIEWSGRDFEGRNIAPGVYLGKYSARNGRCAFKSISIIR